jgi:hypothetical protein
MLHGLQASSLFPGLGNSWPDPHRIQALIRYCFNATGIRHVVHGNSCRATEVKKMSPTSDRRAVVKFHSGLLHLKGNFRQPLGVLSPQCAACHGDTTVIRRQHPAESKKPNLGRLGFLLDNYGADCRT